MSPIIHNTDHLSQTHFPEGYLYIRHAENQIITTFYSTPVTRQTFKHYTPNSQLLGVGGDYWNTI